MNMRPTRKQDRELTLFFDNGERGTIVTFKRDLPDYAPEIEVITCLPNREDIVRTHQMDRDQLDALIWMFQPTEQMQS